jgi:hypothetical protein
MQLPPDLSGNNPGLAHVVIRFSLRLIILGTFASLGKQGFAPALRGFLILAVVFCAFVAVARREALLGPSLTHWDEAAVYGLMAFLLPAGSAG